MLGLQENMKKVELHIYVYNKHQDNFFTLNEIEKKRAHVNGEAQIVEKGTVERIFIDY